MKRASLLLSIVLIALLAFGLGGCADDSGGDDGSEGAGTSSESQDPAVSGEAEDSGSGSGGWVETLPASLPRFAYGDFDEEQSATVQAGSQTIYNMYYEGVEKSEAEEYVAELETAGFNVTRESATDGVDAFGNLTESDGTVVGVRVAWQSSGHVDYTVTVAAASE